MPHQFWYQSQVDQRSTMLFSIFFFIYSSFFYFHIKKEERKKFCEKNESEKKMREKRLKNFPAIMSFHSHIVVLTHHTKDKTFHHHLILPYLIKKNTQHLRPMHGPRLQPIISSCECLPRGSLHASTLAKGTKQGPHPCPASVLGTPTFAPI